MAHPEATGGVYFVYARCVMHIVVNGRESGEVPYSPKCLEKLSEKGYEQPSDRGFGRHTEGEMDRKAPLWRPARLHL